MKIVAVKKELSYLLETSIKSAKDLRLAATTNTKLSEVMEAWSFLNYTEEYSWNTLLNKLVPDNSLITKVKDFLVTNWGSNESDLVMGHAYIEIKHGYELTAVIHLTTDNTLTCASFTGKALFEDLMSLIEIVQDGVNESLGVSSGGGTVAPVNQDEVNSSEINQSEQITETTIVATQYCDNWFKGIPVEHFRSILDYDVSCHYALNTYPITFNTKSVLLTTKEDEDYGKVALIDCSKGRKHEFSSGSNKQLIDVIKVAKQYLTATTDSQYKGVSVEHYTSKLEVYIDSVLKDNTGVLISKYLGTHAVSFNDGEQCKSNISLLEAVKLAKQWLGINTVKVPSTEQAIQQSSLERKSIYA